MTDSERFLAKVSVDEETGCWLWTASITQRGYGRFNYQGEIRLAHRIAYLLFVGPLDDELEVDHVYERGCRYKHCVNPAHLEQVEHRTNCHRGHKGVLYVRPTHCINGHPFDEVNTRIGKWQIHCRACGRKYTQDYIARQRAI